jgi:hypothetical protein
VGFRTIKIIYPEKSTNETKTFTSEVEIFEQVKTIYDTVSFFERHVFPTAKRTPSKNGGKERIPLSNILNIHNADGIRDLVQVREMANAVKAGKHVFPGGMPNVKMVRTKENQLLLFDGHHSILAYMAAGKRYLEEISHMIVEDKDKGYIDDKDIVVFYGEHSKKIPNHDWRQYAINWQGVKEKQLCKRVQRDMEELFSAIKNRIE